MFNNRLKKQIRSLQNQCDQLYSRVYNLEKEVNQLLTPPKYKVGDTVEYLWDYNQKLTGVIDDITYYGSRYNYLIRIPEREPRSITADDIIDVING